ncbi:MAG: replicative DNA helicase [Alphaproteobacteria bacterium]|nr:replicative DNA helicase [Alphaproteobacteria bacterium]
MEAARPKVAPLAREIADATARTPPVNFEAEQQLLGALLANNKAFERVVEFLLPQHFADDRHARIFEAIGQLINRGMVANPVTLKSRFEQDQTLVEIGGAQYLARLASSVVAIINATDYARIVHDLYLRRQLIGLGGDIVNDAYALAEDVAAREQMETAEQKLFELARTGETEGGFKEFRVALKTAIDMAEQAYKRDGHITGVTTGLDDMDKKLGGFHPSDLIILAGRPSMGKTALATKMAFAAAGAYKEKVDENGAREVTDGAKVAFFSLEMSAEQLATRLLSEVTEIPSDKIRRGEIRGDDFPRFVEASQHLHRLPLFIDDTPALSISALRTRSRRLARTTGLGLIVIDYLQLLTLPANMRPESRVQEISAITRGLKAIAKELNVPILALSQLSRAVEQREDKRPQLADLRESGTIEQDADVVMFVYREEYYHARAEPGRRPEESEEKFNDRYEKWQQRGGEIHNVAEVIIGKQRHGPIGTLRLFFDGTYTKFDNLAHSERYGDADDGG